MPFRLDMDEFEDEFPEIKNMRMFGFKSKRERKVRPKTLIN